MVIELKRDNVHKIVDSEERAKKLISLGFKVFKDEENIMNSKEVGQGGPANNQVAGEIDYNSMTLDQLKNICKEKNLDGYASLNKDALVAFMKEKIKG